MLAAVRWLALEVKYLDRAREWYTDHLDLPVRRDTDTDVVLGAGDTNLVLRRSTSVPRGGLHTHYAFSTPADEYDRWESLSDRVDLVEHEFGTSKSLYLDDPDDHCVEIGQRETEGSGITGIFEVVLEVANLDRSEGFYTQLGMEPTSRGDDRRRVRLGGGPIDLELWEPQLGLADARGGVHVDLGFTADHPREAADRVSELARDVSQVDDGIRIRDPDGHVLTVGDE